jgi:hypothetical protein
LALPDRELVQKPNVASSIGTHQTGEATGVPSRLKVVNETYFSWLDGWGRYARPAARAVVACGILGRDDRSQTERPAAPAP